MKKTFKRLGAALLAMAMAVSVLCTGALADGSAKYTITVKNTTNNYQYKAYQVFAGDLATTGGQDQKKILSNITWGKGVDTESKKDADGKVSENGKNLLEAIKAISLSTEITIKEQSTKTPFSNCADAAAVAAILNGQADKSEIATTFAKVVGLYLNADSAEENGWKVPVSSYVETNDTHSTEAHYDIGVNDAGYYLVKNSSVPNNTASTDTAFTNYILEVVGDVAVNPKTDVPKVDKQVKNNVNNAQFGDTTTAQIGEEVTFKLTAKLPSNYADYKSYKLVFKDTLSEGLTMTASELTGLEVKAYPTKDDAEKEVNGVTLKKIDSGSEGYTVSKTDPTTETKTTALDVTFSDLKQATKADSETGTLTIGNDYYIVVTYKATVNKSATIGHGGNENAVHLEYSNDPNATGDGTTGKTPDDKVSVFTFELDVTKVDKDNAETKLPNAKFVLSTMDSENVNMGTIDENGNPTTTTNLIPVVAGTAPLYTVNDNLTNTETKTYVMSTDKDGKLNIAGLKPGTYYLYETKAPDGYNRRTEPFVIVINGEGEKKADKTFDIKTLTIQVDNGTTSNGDKTNGTVSATITNSAGSQLPSTGGMGTTLFYIIGGVLMAGAAVVLVIKKKRSSAE